MDLKQFFIDIGVGALSGAFSFFTGKLFSFAGSMAGLYLNEMCIGGLQVGKVFTDNILPLIFKKVGEVAGGFIGGVYFDVKINEQLGSNDSLTKRITDNVNGTIFSAFLEWMAKLC